LLNRHTVRKAHGIFIICGNFTHVIGGCLPYLEGCNVNHDPDGKFTKNGTVSILAWKFYIGKKRSIQE
jgi:hypothetical protein